MIRAIQIPHQCPHCQGQGHVSKPQHVAGDVQQWSSSATSFVCWICNGVGIIWGPGETDEEIKQA